MCDLIYKLILNMFFGAAFASDKSHRSVLFDSSSSSHRLELVTTPLKTLGDNCARAVETSFIKVITLHHALPEESIVPPRAATVSQSSRLPLQSIYPQPSCLETSRMQPSSRAASLQRVFYTRQQCYPQVGPR